MTTIATDGRTISADGQTTSNGTVTSLITEKLTRLSDGSIVGTAGDSFCKEQFITWLEDQEAPPPLLPEDEFGALQLCADGTVYSWDAKCRRLQVSVPAVEGSGYVVALTAMHLGKSPEEAVQLACQMDVWTGGLVRTMSPK